MQLFQTYANYWAYRIPYKYKDGVVYSVIAKKSMPTHWAVDSQELKDDEVDMVWSDSDLTDLPRIGKQKLITAIFSHDSEVAREIIQSLQR